MSRPVFYGAAFIAGEPADDGTSIDALVMRSQTDYTVCGRTTVDTSQRSAPFPILFGGAKYNRHGSFVLSIDAIPQCLKQGYDFFVNKVWGASTPSTAGGPGKEFEVIPKVSEAALAMSGHFTGQPVPLVYFYGQVFNPSAALPGKSVFVISADHRCQGSGTTFDLYWAPKTVITQPIVRKGFYVVPVQGPCAARTVSYRFYVGGVSPSPPSTSANTPAYGAYGAAREQVLVLNRKP